MENNNITIKGTIDAVFKTDHGPIIIDYKTGKTITNNQKTKKKRIKTFKIKVYLKI